MSLSTKIQIIKNATRVSTLGGDRRVAADAQIKRTRSEIEALLVDYAIKARELAMLADEHA